MILSPQDPIRTLVDVSMSELNVALNVLLVNAVNFPKFRVYPAREVIGLVEIVGPAELASEAISLAKSRFSMGLAPLVLQSLPESIASPDYLKAIVTEITPQQIAELCQQITTYEPSDMPMMLDKDLSEYLAAFLLGSLVMQWRKLPSSLRQEDFLRALKSLQLVHPYLEVSLCTKCKCFGILVGSYPMGVTECQQCKNDLVCARALLLNEELSKLKQDKNKDLPAFIAGYIRSISGGRLTVEPHMRFPPDVEVDVYVAEPKAAVECRLYLREELALGEDEVKSKAGDFCKDIENKRKVGIEHFTIITNLSDNDSVRMEKALQARLRETRIEVGVSLIPGRIDRILEELRKRVQSMLG